jgi:hypothetical protein
VWLRFVSYFFMKVLRFTRKKVPFSCNVYFCNKIRTREISVCNLKKRLSPTLISLQGSPLISFDTQNGISRVIFRPWSTDATKSSLNSGSP